MGAPGDWSRISSAGRWGKIVVVYESVAKSCSSELYAYKLKEWTGIAGVVFVMLNDHLRLDYVI
jgi:hypothetical protein